MIRFYTFPPSDVPYPYILCNARNIDRCVSYLRKHAKIVKAVIIDSGIEIFRDPNVKEYPYGADTWIALQARRYRIVKNAVPHAEVYVTCPDYCDDYHPRALWLSETYTNIERTFDNVLKCVKRYPDVPWLIPIQGHYRDPGSLLKSLELYRNAGLLSRDGYYAIANLCVERSGEIIHRSVLAVRKWLHENLGGIPRLHVFGMKIAALKLVKNMIFSFDSLAWTRPVSSKLYRKYPHSAKNTEQRTLFFCEYIDVLANYGVETPSETIEYCKEQSYI